MVITRKSIPRRTFLRGAGAALALPVLDAMTPALAADAGAADPPGVHRGPERDHDGQVDARDRGRRLRADARFSNRSRTFRDRMLVLSGLDQQQAAALGFEIGGDHPRACTAWLTGAHAR